MHSNSNRLFRWKVISEEYKRHLGSGLPTTQIYSRFIYPKFFISIRTLNSILGTPIDKELKEIGFTQEQINSYVANHNVVLLNSTTPAIHNSIAANPYMQHSKQNQIF